MTWWNNDWDYRLRVKVNSDYVDSNLTDVPLWVRLRDGNFDFTKTTTSGGDEIRFVDYNNTQIPHEITQWNTASGIGDIWVKFSEVSSTEDSYVWMYYGNPTASGVPNYYFDNNLVEDEFPGTTLSGIWSWVAGTGGSYTVSGTQLHMTMGTGDVYGGTYTPTWAYQNVAADEDFFVETKVTNATGAQSQQAGIHFAKASDANGYNVRFGLVFVSAWGGRHVWRDDEIAGVNNDSHTAHAGASTYLRMARIGRTIRTWYSDTGVDGSWTEIAPTNRVHVNEAARVGLFAFSGGGPVITADFDYFHFISMPAHTRVWDDYDLVYHLNEEILDGTPDQVIDSSPVLNHGTSTGHPTPGQVGVVNKSILNDGTDVINTAVYAGVAGNDDRTTMLWFKPTVADQVTWAGMLTYGASSTNVGWFMMSATDTADYYSFLLYGVTADTPTWIAVDPTEGWNHWALNWDGADWKGFYNGNLITNRSASPNTTAGVYYVGNNFDLNRSCEGYLDEVRVSTAALADDEIKVQYLNMAEHSKIMSYDEPDYEGLYPQWLGTWDQRIKLTIDHTKIDEPLEDFPMLITLASGVGLNGADMTPVFDELNYPFNPDDDFTGTNGDPPDPTKWNDGGGLGAGQIQNNKLRLSVGSGSTESYNYYSTYKLAGDFDVQVDYDIILGPSIANWYLSLTVATMQPLWSEKQRANLYREYQGGQKFEWQTYDGSYWTENWASSSETSGKMRITRVGSTWTAYYDIGGGWVSLGASVYLNETGDVLVRLRLENYAGSDPAVTTDFDNFIVNNGTVKWGNQDSYISDFPNRKKFAVTTWNGTQECYVEINRWEQHDELASIWTKVPYISNVEDTILYLYYDSSQPDNDNYVGDTTDIAARRVWDDNFVMIHHMERGPTANQYDSTQNATNTTASNNFEDTDQVNGLIGKAISGDGVDESFDLPTTGILEVSPFTIEVLLQKDTQGSNVSLMAYQPKGSNAEGRGWILRCNSDKPGLLKGSGDGSWESVFSTAAINNGEYHHVVVRFETDTLFDILVNGIIENSETDPGELIAITYADSGSSSNPPTKQARIFCSIDEPGADAGFADGKIDEIRISDTVRSVSWVRATNYTARDNLISFGSPENTDVFRFQGTVLVEGSPAARKVYLYRRDTGELVREVTSSEIDGLFEAGSPNWDYHFFVILPELTETFDLIGHDKLHPGN